MKKALHILALTSLVASASGCTPVESTPEESGILDEYVNDVPTVETPSETTPVKEPATPTEVTPTESSLKYKDGTYSASGKYQSPAGTDTLQVSITVKDDVVTAVNITPASPNEVSLQI